MYLGWLLSVGTRNCLRPPIGAACAAERYGDTHNHRHEQAQTKRPSLR